MESSIAVFLMRQHAFERLPTLTECGRSVLSSSWGSPKHAKQCWIQIRVRRRCVPVCVCVCVCTLRGVWDMHPLAPLPPGMSDLGANLL